VALTFDDGPSSYTAGVMAILEKYRAPATFFCIGEQAAQNPTAVADLKAAGFEVEDHSWDHPDLVHLMYPAILSEITRPEQVLGPTKYFRPPYGYYDLAVREAAATAGMKIVRWDVDTLDWKYPAVASILGHVEAEVKPGAIVLMHDGGGDRSQTVVALPAVIDWLRSQHYTLVTLSQLLAGAATVPGTTAAAGT
jgi:peptidoglycan/xylan/chitin deacetylase (PgdA/CDA1 family)